jgi:hypothetical protein
MMRGGGREGWRVDKEAGLTCRRYRHRRGSALGVGQGEACEKEGREEGRGKAALGRSGRNLGSKRRCTQSLGRGRTDCKKSHWERLRGVGDDLFRGRKGDVGARHRTI